MTASVQEQTGEIRGVQVHWLHVRVAGPHRGNGSSGLSTENAEASRHTTERNAGT